MSIKELNSIYAFGYGLFIYSPGTFNEWMQKRRNAEQRKCCRILISIRICFWK